MGVRNVALVLCLTPAWMLTGHAARAGMNDILVGLDEKVVYDANGQTTGPGGKDAVLVMDVTDPAHPKIRASLPLANSLLGPPTRSRRTANSPWWRIRWSTPRTAPRGRPCRTTSCTSST
jgi:hypothetical protein